MPPLSTLAPSSSAPTSSRALVHSPAVSAALCFDAPGLEFPATGSVPRSRERLAALSLAGHADVVHGRSSCTGGPMAVRNGGVLGAPVLQNQGRPAASRAAVMVGGAIGLGAVGVAAFGAAPAQAAPVQFPEWATVTGTVPDDQGFDRAAAEANHWTFSWSTDADGVVTFVYADGSTSNSANPPAPAAAADQDLAVQSTPTALWATAEATVDPAAPSADTGMEDLASAVSAPFGGNPAPVIPSGTDRPAAAVSDQAILDTAHQGLGGAYVWGGTDFMSWDCSGYVQWVYAQHGMEIPRVTWDQFAAATPTSSPRPGDLVSQNNGAHVGIYVGGDQMISALNPQEGTIVHSVHAMPLDGYYTFR